MDGEKQYNIFLTKADVVPKESGIPLIPVYFIKYPTQDKPEKLQVS